MAALDMRGEHHVNTSPYGGKKNASTCPFDPPPAEASGLKQAHGTTSATSAMRKPGASR